VTFRDMETQTRRYGGYAVVTEQDTLKFRNMEEQGWYRDYVVVTEQDPDEKWKLIRMAAEELERAYDAAIREKHAVRIQESEMIEIYPKRRAGFTIVCYAGKVIMTEEEEHGDYEAERTAGRAGTGGCDLGELQQERNETGTITGI